MGRRNMITENNGDDGKKNEPISQLKQFEIEMRSTLQNKVNLFSKRKERLVKNLIIVWLILYSIKKKVLALHMMDIV